MTTKYQQGLFLSKDKCLACKIFSAPLFIGVATYFATKNRLLWPNTPKAGKFLLVAIPTVLYVGGIVNIYQGYNIFQAYQQDKELWTLMKQEGAFEGMDQSQSNEYFYKIKQRLQDQQQEATKEEVPLE